MRGYTLIETMICVAILGITAALSGFTGAQMRMTAIAQVQQEQAQLMLDYHASAISGGRVPDPEVAARLAAELPDAVYAEDVRGGAVVALSVHWRDPHRRTVRRELIVFRRGSGR